MGAIFRNLPSFILIIWLGSLPARLFARHFSNFTVWAGFVHTAFSFSHECLIARNRQLSKVQLPPGALISFIQKGLQLARIEAHLDEVTPCLRCCFLEFDPLRDIFSLQTHNFRRYLLYMHEN